MVESEELKKEKRVIKVQYNVVADENIRLKTKLQFTNTELGKKEKEIENLSMKLQ
jgi:hypothetical protein